jgi:hypothetical protein
MSGMLGGLGAVNVAGMSDLSVGLQNINQQLSNLFKQIGVIQISLPSIPAGDLFGNPGTIAGQPSPVTPVGGIALATDGNLTVEWNAGTITAVGSGLTISGTTLEATGSTAPAFSQATPGNPTGTTSTVGVMMGLAGAITPAVSGHVLLMVSGTIFNPTAIADGGKVQIRYGTGGAPANAASLTGTAVGGLVQYIAATTAETAPFAVQAVVTGLAVSTTYWIDVGLAAITGGTATISDLSVSAIELA